MGSKKKFTLHKQEILSSKLEISHLFSVGKNYQFPPISVLVCPTANKHQGYHKVLFLASKRKFPKAVERNRAKRLLREVYRLNKHYLNTNQPLHLGIALHKKGATFQEIELGLKSFMTSYSE